MSVADRVAPKAEKRLPEAERPNVEIIVYICPTEGCGNHIATPTFRPDRSDIHKVQMARSQNDGRQYETHPRTECPVCRVVRGKHVQRIPYIVTEVVPLDKVIGAIKEREVSNETT